MTEIFRRHYLAVLCALAFYVTGASFVQSFVNYPTWRLIGAAEFQAYHQAMSALIIKVMVLPWLLEIVLTVLLLWLRPQPLPRWPVVLALTLHLIAFISTALIQIPIQTQLSEHGLSLAHLEKLLATDPIRWVAGLLRTLLCLGMMCWLARPVAQSQWRRGH